ncbi:MAG: hypothetical protein AABW91_00700 [Nanoarchaeota archaeon]
MKKISFVIIVLFILASMPFVIAVIDWSNPTNTEFNSGGNVVCSIQNGEAKWIENNQIINASNACFKASGITEGGIPQNTCCASGFQCNTNTQKCEFVININSCGDYTTKEKCENFNPNSVKNSIESLGRGIVGSSPGNFCDSPREVSKDGKCAILSGPCECRWDNVANKCQSFFLIEECSSDDPYITYCRTQTNQIINKCNTDNVYEISWTGQVVDSVGEVVEENTQFCKDGVKTFPCPSTSKVPFFGMFSLIVSLFIIGVVYFFARKK